MKYDKITLVDPSKGAPVVVENVEASTLADLKKQINQVDWSNKAVTVRGNNTSLELEDAKLPQGGSMVLFLTTIKLKGGATKKELVKQAKDLGLTGYSRMTVSELEAEIAKKSKATAKPKIKPSRSKLSPKKAVADVVESVKASKNDFLDSLSELEHNLAPVLLVINKDMGDKITASIEKLKTKESSYYTLDNSPTPDNQTLIKEASRTRDTLESTMKRKYK